MANKVQQYLQLSDYAAKQITSSYKEWTGFLATAGRLYKYPFPEHLMIYAQRPDATACADYDLWNKQMRRYVMRGAKGIALIDTSTGENKVRYVFDVSDTGERENARPWLWQYRPEHQQPVTALFEKMTAEQDKYRAWLVTQPPEEILNHAYEDVCCKGELQIPNTTRLRLISGRWTSGHEKGGEIEYFQAFSR